MYVYTHRDTGSYERARRDPERTPAAGQARPDPPRPIHSPQYPHPAGEDPDPHPDPHPGPGRPAVYLLPAPHAPPAAPIGSRPTAGREGPPRPPIRPHSRRSAHVPAYGQLSSNRREEREEARPIGRRLSPPSRWPVAACEAAAPPWRGGGGRCPGLGSRWVPEGLGFERAVKVIQFQTLVWLGAFH